MAKKGDLRELLKSKYAVDRYKDFWLPWLDMVQSYVAKQGITMVYEWSMANQRLEAAFVFTVGDQEFLTITYCDWGKSPEFHRRTANTFVQRILYEKNLKEATIH